MLKEQRVPLPYQRELDVTVSKSIAKAAERVSLADAKQIMERDLDQTGVADVYLFVVREGRRVAAVNLRSLEEMDNVEGPYLGYHIDDLATSDDVKDFAGYAEFGESIGGVTGLFVSGRGERQLVDELANANLSSNRTEGQDRISVLKLYEGGTDGGR